MSPLELADTFIAETAAAWRGKAPDPDHYASNSAKGAGVMSPLMGFVLTIWRAWSAGNLFAVIQIAIGCLAFATFNMVRSKGKSIWLGFGENAGMIHSIVTPFAIIGAASLIAFALQMIMLLALSTLHWVTGLAGAAAGATGVVGFYWYCVSKLGEKGAEHALTPKI